MAPHDADVGTTSCNVRPSAMPSVTMNTLCHAWGRVCWLYLEHLVPLLIWILTSCPFYTIWEVLLAINARWFLTSWGTYIFIMHACIFILLKAIAVRRNVLNMFKNISIRDCVVTQDNTIARNQSGSMRSWIARVPIQANVTILCDYPSFHIVSDLNRRTTKIV